MFERKTKIKGRSDSLTRRLEEVDQEGIIFQLFVHWPVYWQRKTEIVEMFLEEECSIEKAWEQIKSPLAKFQTFWFAQEESKQEKNILRECSNLLTDEKGWESNFWEIYLSQQKNGELYQNNILLFVETIYAEIKARKQEKTTITQNDPLALVINSILSTFTQIVGSIKNFLRIIHWQIQEILEVSNGENISWEEMELSLTKENEILQHLRKTLDVLYTEMREFLITYSLLEHESSVFRLKGGPKPLLVKKHGYGLPSNLSALTRGYKYYLFYEVSQHDREEEAYEDSGLSGDLYYHEEVQAKNRYLLLAHGDAQGHGAKAARIKYEILKAIKISGSQAQLQDSLVRYLRERLCFFINNYTEQTRDLSENKVFQLQWLLFDFTNGELYSFDFGHGMCFAIQKDKQILHLKNEGAALITGLSRKSEYLKFIKKHNFTPLKLKNILFLVVFSDCLIEEPQSPENEDRQYMDVVLGESYELGEKQNIYSLFFEQLLRQIKGKKEIEQMDCKMLAESILNDFFEFKENKAFSDDMTLLVIDTQSSITRFLPKRRRPHNIVF